MNDTRKGLRGRLAMVLALIASIVMPAVAAAQTGRVLGREDIRLYGLGLKVEPAQQTVPRDIATIVPTFLQAPQQPDGLPPFAADAEVRGTLRGPSFPTPVELRTAPNSPFNIPPLPIAGTYTLENIRLVSGGEVLLRAVPEHVTIDVIDQLLVTQVTARALTAAEIREKGIVFDRSNFQAYNFSAAFAIQDRKVNLDFPVVLPRLDVVGGGVPTDTAGLPAINAPALPQLRTIIPDTLKLQTRIPNLAVVGFTLKVKSQEGQQLVAPPIPGVVVIPGDIGFLNQYFSVMLMVGNAAPGGSNLSVDNLRATIILPKGRDNAPGTADDPLAMANTARGVSPSVQPVTQPGPDGRLGTSDDVIVLAPGESGNAEYLVEGKREGSHAVEMAIAGTLHGLPGGPVEVQGRATGAVLVRNPTFSLTFTHPEVVTAGEAYTLDVTISNTSSAPANFVSLNLSSAQVAGAEILGEASHEIESIAPGDAATVTFTLRARRTGKVTASTLDGDGNVAGRFALKTGVGELGVPLSPDSLVLPKEARELHDDLEQAAIGLLGRAYAVATAPPAALPPGLRRFSRKIVLDRAVEVAEAGFRQSLGEPEADAAAQLLMDFAGSNVGRIAQRFDNAEDRQFETANFLGFDELRRASVRGDVFAGAIAARLAPSLAGQSPAAFHMNLAEEWSYRPGHLSILVASSAGALAARAIVRDAQGRAVGEVRADGKIVKQIPYSDVLVFPGGGGNAGQLVLLAAPAAGAYTVELQRLDGATGPVSVSVVLPSADGTLRQVVYSAVESGRVPAPAASADGSVQVTFTGAAATVAATSTAPVQDPLPRVLGAVLQPTADRLTCEVDKPGPAIGRIIAVLFSEEINPASVQDRLAAEAINAFAPAANRAVGVALQPGRRIAFVALRDPIGPHVPRQITVRGAKDTRGQEMQAWTGPMNTAGSAPGGVLSGRVLHADGTPMPYANVRFFYQIECDDEKSWVGVSSKPTDANGAYSWDHVLSGFPVKVVAIDPEATESRELRFSVQRDGQSVNADVVFLGRGTVAGLTRLEDGTLLRDTAVRVTSLTDGSEFGGRSGADGRFSIERVPVGNIFIEAVHTGSRAQIGVSDVVPFAGATVQRELLLQRVETPNTETTYGSVTGHVLRGDQVTGVADVPVIAYYRNLSQPGLRCPGNAPPECPIALVQTSATGEFLFERIPSGTYRLEAIDQATFAQGEIGLVLPAAGSRRANVVLNGGLARVEGVVVDAGDSAVPNARVGGGLSLTTTNNEGKFVLPDVPVGRREIVAVSDALGSRGSITLDILKAGDVVPAKIVLAAVGRVIGTVRKADGTPVAGVKVHLFDRAGDSVDVRGTATTNENGAYEIVKVPAEKPLFVSAFNAALTDGGVVPVIVRRQNEAFRADITFRGGNGGVTGTVLDAAGVTPLRARVGISGERIITAGQVGVGFQHVDNWAIVDTDASGRFSFSGVLAGEFTLQAVGAFSPDPITAVRQMPSDGATVDVPLRLQDTSSLTGTLFESDGVTPVTTPTAVTYKSAEYRMVCTGSEETRHCESVPQGIQELTVATNAAGRFLFPLVTAGDFTLTVADEQGRRAQARGTVKPGETGDIALRLLNRPALVVTVKSNNQNVVPRAVVKVTQIGYPARSLQLEADDNGVATFGGAEAFAEGQVTIEARNGSGFAGRLSVTLPAAGTSHPATVFLNDDHGSVTGTLYAPDGFTRVPNAEVVLSTSGGPLAFAVTDAQGAFTVSTVPVGNFTIESFEARTARRAFTTGSVFTAGQSVVADLQQGGVGLVTGRALDSRTLAGLRGWTVTLQQTSPGGRSLPTLQTTTSADGSFSFPGAARGQFVVSARRTGIDGTGRATGELHEDGGSADVPVLVTIRSSLTGTVTGRVRTSAGAVAGTAQVDICPAATCEAHTWTGARRVSVDPADGSFSLTGVPIGRYQVRAVAQTGGESGYAAGQLLFDGDVSEVVVAMNGVTTITGTVRDANGNPVAGVTVALTGTPAPGCPGGVCTTSTNPQGAFTFAGQPVRTFQLEATDLVTTLKGSLGGTAIVGTNPPVTIMLEPTAVVTGRVLTASGAAATGVVAKLLINAGKVDELALYDETDANGVFRFAAARLGTYELVLDDTVAQGKAVRHGQIVENLDLGTIALDEAPPVVAAMTPAASSTTAPTTGKITITFSEPVQRGTATQAQISVASPTGAVTVSFDYSDDDRSVILTPQAALPSETRFTVRAQGVKDLIGRPMAAPYVASFTTKDVTAPAIAEVTPQQNVGGVPVTTTIRVKFSEAIDPSVYSPAAPAIVLTGPSGPVPGGISYGFGNTVIAFTPQFPLAENAAYQVRVAASQDLAGNPLEAFTYQFATTDRTPPVLAGLVSLSGPTVIEHAFAHLRAQTSLQHDVDFVDFFVNGALLATDHDAPFELSVQALPQYAAPGQQILVAALPTDTSGNQGVAPALATLSVVPDAAPQITIVAPTATTVVKTGQQVTVTLRGTDDVGVKRLAFQAQPGTPTSPTSMEFPDGTTDTQPKSFTFIVPATASPGAMLTIDASAVDGRGHTTQVTPLQLRIEDTLAPEVTVTAGRVVPGEKVTVVVSATDAGGVANAAIVAGGIIVCPPNPTCPPQSRAIEPAQTTVSASFTLDVPPTAKPGQSLSVNATVRDVAGNVTTAPQMLFPVVDRVAPTVAITPYPVASNRTMPVGGVVRVRVTGEDSDVVNKIKVVGTGAFDVVKQQGVTPGGSVEAILDISVPPTTAVGAVLTLQATAFDASNNESLPAVLVLTAGAPAEVKFVPASTIVEAGARATVTLDLGIEAPANGVGVEFSTTNANVATIDPVLVPGNSRTVDVEVQGVASGTATLRAVIAGTPQGSLTVTVNGGIVRGVVRDSLLRPVAGAEVTISDGLTSVPAISAGDGSYSVNGLVNPQISVTAVHPESRLYGHATGTLTRTGGYAVINPILLSAGAIAGRVTTATGEAVGANVRVDIFERYGTIPLSTTFTDDGGAYSFPFVTIGDYVLEASTPTQRGRALAAVVRSGETVDVPIAYLGQGTVTVTVRNATTAINGATVRVTVRNAFGQQPLTEKVTAGSGAAAGQAVFTDVPLGAVEITVQGPAPLFQGAATTVHLTTNGQSLTPTVVLGSYAPLTGVVRRANGTSTVAGARVVLDPSGYGYETITDANGVYTFAIVPVGTYIVTANEPGTRAQARGQAAVLQHNVQARLDLQMAPQGRLLVTVRDGGGTPVPNASVRVWSTFGAITDLISTSTASNGQVLVENVLAGAVSVYGSTGSLGGTAKLQLAAGEQEGVVIDLAPTGSVEGTVTLPGSELPLAGGSVLIDGRRATIAANGSYRMDGLKAGSYTAVVYDAAGVKRAEATASAPIVIATHNEVVTRNFEAVHTSVVRGTLLSGATGVIGATVTIESTHPYAAGQKLEVRSTEGGVFEFKAVWPGTFHLRAERLSPAPSLAVDRLNQTVPNTGATVNLGNITMGTNTQSLPLTLFDANGATWDVQRDGYINNGSTAFSQASLLSLRINGGAEQTFTTGATSGTRESGNREIAVRQTIAAAGLEVTRKVFVPTTGYFARYLEIFTNVGTQPVSLDARVVHNLRPGTTAAVVSTTSSGDTQVAAADRWVAFAPSANGGQFRAMLFDAPAVPEGFEQRDLVTYTTNGTSGALAAEWQSLSVAPGTSVVLMHVMVQQVTAAAATASMARLEQLPPELLEGLSEDERRQIRNFPVPLNGGSALEPLPAVNGSVSGVVYEGQPDRREVPGATVRFTSAVPYYPRTLGGTLASNVSAFSFASTSIGTSSASVPVPVAPFVIEATHPTTQEKLTINGGFINGTTQAVQHVEFSTGYVSGVVRRQGTAVGVSGGRVSTVVNGTTRDVFLGANGTFLFGGLPAGTYTFTATHPTTSGVTLTGTLTLTLQAGQSAKDQVIELEGTTTVSGVVYRADDSRAPGQTVRLKIGNTTRTVTTDAATTATPGAFRFVDVVAGNYTLEASDSRLRVGNMTEALATAAASLTVGSAAVQQDLILRPVGSVNGVVKGPGGVDPGVVKVRLDASMPGWPIVELDTTAQGAFTFPVVPAGPFMVTAVDRPRGLVGEASGEIVSEGVAVTLEFEMAANHVLVPFTLRDGNGFGYQIDANGQISSGQSSVFNTFSFSKPTHGAVLSVTSGGTTAKYEGSNDVAGEDGGREIVMPALRVNGLEVRRKIFVPQRGYFARYLEVLRNPSAAPITVDVQVDSTSYGAATAHTVTATSSGDVMVSLENGGRDRWITTNDLYDGDPFVGGEQPALAFAFEGTGAAPLLSALTYTPETDTTSRLQYRWNSITVPAGQTVILMHFVAQQMYNVGAQATAERLVQLPPEALTGLSAEERAAIANFVVPEDGVGTVAPLQLDGRITGTVFGGDGVTPTQSAQVTLQSGHPLFQRKRTVNSGSDGSFVFDVASASDGLLMVIPVHAFSLAARHEHPRPTQGSAAGDFAAGELVASKNVVLSGGVLQVIARTATGTLLAGANVTVENDGAWVASATTPADGAVKVSALPADTYEIVVRLPLTGGQAGTELVLSRSVNVAANQLTAATFEFPGLGAVAGALTRPAGGAVAGTATLRRLAGPAFLRSFASANGSFSFTRVPAGEYRLEYTVPGEEYKPSRTIVVVADETVAGDLVMPEFGRVFGTMFQANGTTPAANATAELRGANGEVFLTVIANGQGDYSTTNAPSNVSLVLRTYHPLEPRLFIDSEPFTLATGSEQRVDIRRPGMAALQVTVTRDGSPLSGAMLEIQHGLATFFTPAGTTNGSGVATIAGVPEGRWTLRVRSGQTGALLLELDDTLDPALDGQTVPVAATVAAAASANVRGIVVAADGVTPVANATVSLRDRTGREITTLTSGADGRFDAGVIDADPNGLVLRAVSPSGAVSVEQPGRTDGGDVELQLDVRVATLGGTVFAANQTTKVPGAVVTVKEGTRQVAQATTDANGDYSVALAVAGDGSFSAEAATADGIGRVSHAGQVTVQAEALSQNFTLPLTLGSVAGRVLAGDGTVAVPAATVTLKRPDGTVVASTDTAADGTYAFPTVLAEAAGVRVEASAKGRGGPFVKTADLTLATGANALDLRLDVTAIVGTATDSTGATLMPSAFAFDAEGLSYFAHAAAANGAFMVLGVPVGPVSVFVQRVNTQIAETIERELPSSGVLVADVTLPAGGTVTGKLTTTGGDPLPSDVGLVSSGTTAGYVYRTTTLADGIFTFTDVPAGPAYVGAYEQAGGQASLSRGSKETTVVASTTTNVVFPVQPFGAVTTTIAGTTQCCPTVTVTSDAGAPALGFLTQGSAFPMGGTSLQFITGVPRGNLRITVKHDGAVGVAYGHSSMQPFAVTLGNATTFPFTLSTDGGVDYRVSESGRLGGNAGSSFSQGHGLTVNGSRFTGHDEGLLELSGRQIVLGPNTHGVLRVVRKVFVSPTGFVRYLDIVQNVSSIAQTVELGMISGLTAGQFRAVVAPGAASGRYAVTDDGVSGTPTRGAVAHVFSGAGQVAARPRVSSATIDGSVRVTVPAGATRAVLRFVSQHAVGASDAAAAQAEALSSLSDPQALTGLTAAERSWIVNFVVPQ